MRIGYFGGSFDPPHRGHLAVARAARDRFGLDRLLLAPTANQPLKPNGPQAPWPNRLRMTELLCEGEPGLEASAIDGPQPGGIPNYTVDTLRRLRSNLNPAPLGSHPRSESASPSTTEPELFAILGADAFHTFPHWREPDELLTLADWIIVSRPGYPPPVPATLGLTASQSARIHPLTGLANPLSATALRQRLTTDRFPVDAIPDSVLRYIHDYGLYAG